MALCRANAAIYADPWRGGKGMWEAGYMLEI